MSADAQIDGLKKAFRLLERRAAALQYRLDQLRDQGIDMLTSLHKCFADGFRDRALITKLRAENMKLRATLATRKGKK